MTSTRPILTLPIPADAPKRQVLTLVKKPVASAPAPRAPEKLTPDQARRREAKERTAALKARATAARALKLYLMHTYPDAFPRPPATPAPLAIGIDQAIREAVGAQYSRRTFDTFVRRWTREPAYLAAVAAGEPRRNLDGSLAGTPTDDERAQAAEKLAVTSNSNSP